MRVLRAAIQRYAPVQVSVVVLGETGTGKELVASALASLGRPSRPFVAFNASTTPGPLVDSTLFGHERGAFTDAKQSRPGLFRAAHGGTLFLDEVGDLPAETQAKLLRVLEEGRVLPVGATASIAVDVRLVSATHKDLLSEVEAGRFRADLYARLAFVVLRLSPLRDRPEDIPVLAQAFASGRRFEPSAMTALLLHPWPFNARELKAVVGQMVLETPASRRLDLPQGVRDRLAEHRRLFGGEPQPRETAGRPPAGTLDRAAVEQALRQGRGNMTRAAEIAGRDRSHFYRMVRRFGLVPEDFRP
jgi:DNA-binding NtrC family response regulator